MIKICKKPFICEYEDRWGIPTGEFYVNETVGYLEESKWGDIQQFENYYNSKEGSAEIKDCLAQLQSGIPIEKINAPIMKELLSKGAYQQIWQFNLYPVSNKTNECIRTFAIFGEQTLRAWTPDHDIEVSQLRAQLSLKESLND